MHQIHTAREQCGKLRLVQQKLARVVQNVTAHHHCINFKLSIIYTVNHKKGGSTFVIITLENLDGFR